MDMVSPLGAQMGAKAAGSISLHEVSILEGQSLAMKLHFHFSTSSNFSLCGMAINIGKDLPVLPATTDRATVTCKNCIRALQRG